MPFFSESQRSAIAEVLATIAKDGLPGPRDLDVALDAIECTLKEEKLTVLTLNELYSYVNTRIFELKWVEDDSPIEGCIISKECPEPE